MSEIKIKYGLNKHKEMISVNELDETMNGLECNLYCPKCGDRLVACQGKRLGDIWGIMQVKIENVRLKV